MQATLTFSLPDEQEDFDDATKGGSGHCACNEIADWLCAETKSAEPQTRTDRHRIAVLYEVRDRVWEIIRDRRFGK